METKQPQSYWVQSLGAIGVAFELGFIIALPVAVLAFVGKKLDTHFGTHFIVYVGLVVALTSSTLWLYARFEALVVRLQKISAPKKIQNTSEDDSKR
jgi:amino acid transporter